MAFGDGPERTEDGISAREFTTVYDPALQGRLVAEDTVSPANNVLLRLRDELAEQRGLIKALESRLSPVLRHTVEPRDEGEHPMEDVSPLVNQLEGFVQGVRDDSGALRGIIGRLVL